MTYPLIFNKLPSTFEHQCTIWTTPSSLVHQLMDEWYYENVPKGERTVIDVFSPDKVELSLNCWYVVDLHALPPNQITNEIKLEGLSSLSSFDQGQVLYDVYSRVKGLVVFASKLEDIPVNIQSLSVLTMTAKENGKWQGVHRFDDHLVCWG